MPVTQEAAVKKGRHRRFEEARALKRSHDVDFEDLLETISGSDDDEETHKPEHDAWADVAEEWQRVRSSDVASDTNGPTSASDGDGDDPPAGDAVTD